MTDRQADIARVKSSGGFSFWGLDGQTFIMPTGRVVTLDEALAILDDIERRQDLDDDE